MWSAFTGTTCSPQVPDSLKPTFFIVSTCSGHCSMSVTSWPAFVSMPPTIEPMAPAPMMPILVAMSPPTVVGERERLEPGEESTIVVTGRVAAGTVSAVIGAAAFESRARFRYN
jgi:hypothetical protein